MMLDLRAVIERGLEKKEDRPALSMHGWAMSYLNAEGRDWNESSVHVSDYAVALPEDDRKCQRQLKLRTEGAEAEEQPVWEHVMFSQGNAMETRCAWWLSLGLPDCWSLYDIQHDLREGLPEGHAGVCDIILQHDDGRLLVVEVKTSRGRAFQYREEAKPSHDLQASTYREALSNMHPKAEVDATIIYLDREGQNPPDQYEATMSASEVYEAAQLAEDIVNGERAPEMQTASVEVRRNKGDDSYYVDNPWQCDYCEYRDVSCPGALPDALTGQGIVCKTNDDEIENATWKVEGDDKREKLERQIDQAIQNDTITEK